MLKFEEGKLTEDSYEIGQEPSRAALFCTGNGYMGVRGSFEEFGSLRIQGAYVRGYIDEIIEVIEPFADNEYMKKYYFDEEKLKDFEKQESCVNLADFLYAEVLIDGIPFSTLNGKILSWKRFLDPKTAVLTRMVEWDNGKGDITALKFERFASYYNQHIYCQRITVTAKNHQKSIKLITGIDANVKTGGQKITSVLQKQVQNDSVNITVCSGKKYGFQAKITAVCKAFSEEKSLSFTLCKDKELCLVTESQSKEISFEKKVIVAIDRDGESFNNFDKLVLKEKEVGYEKQYDHHLKKYQALLEKTDIQIEGDPEADSALRFSTYHTLISANAEDAVHGISAKGLTGERYNQFVWWDCEIYQLPVFIYTHPDIAKNALMYRYNLLQQSKQNAKDLSLKGAKYAFCSSVTGEERVWIYARHPFLQVHINSDVAWGIIHYVSVTGDTAFLKNYGLEMLIEIARYWASRVTFQNNRYEILNVTGTDEHHPYVDNDAYTNYLTAYVLKKTLDYLDKEFAKDVIAKTSFSIEEISQLRMIAENIYLPICENGLIPQFDGYFSLSKTLELQGNGTGKSFQMKQSGLYHKSQIIKQPDVMLLFSFFNLEIEKANYPLNWDYYEAMCEKSSSLTFPVHAVCAADNGRMMSFYKDFMDTVKVDIDDLHKCAWQGIHSGCAASGWYAVFRGIAGIVCKEDGIHIHPKLVPWWKSVTLRFDYKGSGISLHLTAEKSVIKLLYGKPVSIFNSGKIHFLTDEFCFKASK